MGCLSTEIVKASTFLFWLDQGFYLNVLIRETKDDKAFLAFCVNFTFPYVERSMNIFICLVLANKYCS